MNYLRDLGMLPHVQIVQFDQAAMAKEKSVKVGDW